MSNTSIDTYEYTYNDIYESYIVCSKAGIKKHICYDYNEAIDFIYNFTGKYMNRSYRAGIRIDGIYRDNKGMHIIGIPYIYKCLDDYKTIYTHI